MNLYLYIPPLSAHPSGMIKGLLYSTIQRYKRQNIDRKDYVEMVRLLYQHYEILDGKNNNSMNYS
eukprot:13215569-Ditylum_brightwellii.AAC.1